MIFTDSAFYYGIEVTQANRAFVFLEGVTQFTATMQVGKYTHTDFASEIARAMNGAGGANTYGASIDRKTRITTITGSGVFSLPVTSLASSAFDLMGFVGADKTGASAYVGTLAVGFAYRPQFRLQSFVNFDDSQEAVESSVLESASGKVEVVRFGVRRIMECEIRLITDIDQGVGGYVRTDFSGVANARAFMQYAVTKGEMEFIPDFCSPESFRKCILESTPESASGVSFKLKEEFSSGLTGYYTTGLLKFRGV